MFWPADNASRLQKPVAVGARNIAPPETPTIRAEQCPRSRSFGIFAEVVIHRHQSLIKLDRCTNPTGSSAFQKPLRFEFAAQAVLVILMNKAEIAAALRKEVGELEVLIIKLQTRLERSKQLVLDIEEEVAGPQTQTPLPDSKFRKAIDSVFGEKPKRPRH